MSRTFMPKGSYIPKPDGFTPTFRYYREANWTPVPGAIPQATIDEAISVAEDYMAKQLNPPIRSERMPEIGIGQWKSERAERIAEQQRADLKAFVVVERKKS